jgi:hypothetical protein
MAGINIGPLWLFCMRSQRPYFAAFPAIIVLAYSNNGPFGWFLQAIMRVLPAHFLVSGGFNKVQS